MTVRDLVIEAAREFNAGRYFEAHEVLEDGLDDVPDALWDLFVGLIQIAVGYHKASRQLWNGSATMLANGLEKVDPFPPQAGGLDLEMLRRRVRADVEKLRTGTFDPATLASRPPRFQPKS